MGLIIVNAYAGVSGFIRRFRELALYCLIGCTGATLDFLVYSGLVSFAGIHYQLANFLSVAAGITNNFFLNCYFNFRTRDRIWMRFASFYVVGMVGLAVSALCLWVLTEVFAFNVFVAKLGTIVVVTAIQFALNKTITFRKSDAAGQVVPV